MATSKIKAQYKEIPLKNILVRTQSRTIFEDTLIMELADNMRQVGGVLQPVTVRPAEAQQPEDETEGLYELVAGERRVRAAKLAGFTKIPSLIKILTDEQAMDIHLSENLQRKDLTPMEEALAFRKAIEEQQVLPLEIAARLGKKVDYVLARVRLNNLSEEAQQFLHQRVLPLDIAALIAPLQEGDQKKFLKACLVRKQGPGDADNNQPGSWHCKSLSEVKWYLQQHVFNALETAPFSKHRRVPGVDMPACAACKLRTGFNDSLFHDIVANDRCLAPKCYQAKSAAHFANLAARFEEAQGQPVQFVRLSYDTPSPKKVLEKDAVRFLLPHGDPCPKPRPVCVLEKGKEPRIEQACTNSRCVCRAKFKSSPVNGERKAQRYTPAQVQLARQRMAERRQPEHYRQLLTDTIQTATPADSPAAMRILVLVLTRQLQAEHALELLAQFGFPVLNADGSLYKMPISRTSSTLSDVLFQRLQTLHDEKLLAHLAWGLLLHSPLVQADYLGVLAPEYVGQAHREALAHDAAARAEAEATTLFESADFHAEPDGSVSVPRHIVQRHRLFPDQA